MSDVVQITDPIVEELKQLNSELIQAKLQLAEITLQKHALLQGIFLAQQSLSKRANELAKEMNLDVENEQWQLDVQNSRFVKNVPE